MFKVKMIGAIIVLAILLFYVLPCLISELYFMPLRQEIEDTTDRAPLRVEVNETEKYSANNFEFFDISIQGKACLRGNNNNVISPTVYGV